LGFGPFREALTLASERGLKGAVALANTRLVESVDSGDLKSVQYLHELTGYFTPGRQQSLDTQQLVRDVMTVVLRRVRDLSCCWSWRADFRGFCRSRCLLLVMVRVLVLVGGCSGFGESDGIVDVSTVIDSEDV